MIAIVDCVCKFSGFLGDRNSKKISLLTGFVPNHDAVQSESLSIQEVYQEYNYLKLENIDKWSSKHSEVEESVHKFDNST